MTPERSNPQEQFRVATIGTGCCIPQPGRNGSCTLVSAAGVKIVIDLGLGSLVGLVEKGVSHRDIDLLLFTHTHVDHTAELASMLFAANYDEEVRTRTLTMVGTAGFNTFFADLAGVYGRWGEPQNYRREVVEIIPGALFEAGRVAINTLPVNHDPTSVAYRISLGDKSVTITGDTGPTEGLAGFARGCDLLICEASLPDGTETDYHMNARQAGALAREAGVEQLVLTHFYPSSEEGDPALVAKEEFSGPVTVARDGMEFVL